MFEAAIRFPCFLLVCLLSGCCACMNMTGGCPGNGDHAVQLPYGGAALDALCIAGSLTGETENKSGGSSDPSTLARLAAAGFYTVDLPLSAAMDTLELPWTVTATIKDPTRLHDIIEIIKMPPDEEDRRPAKEKIKDLFKGSADEEDGPAEPRGR